MIPRNLLISSRSSSAAIALFHTSARRAAAQPKHTSETYNKDDSDMSPPPDSKIHRVDPNSDSQKPHEAPSGPYSRVGAESAEYKNTNSNMMKTRALRQAKLMRDQLENPLKAGSLKGDEVYMEKWAHMLPNQSTK
ncbi:hypothetical protein LENED_000144 [Lentinula edodes]|uniref:Uncharacterized protein n=1 Tax=Lentinula edodes TaxID=5353 RepID=A0A1Q3DUS1_LENED|nr:hypothetical protein LENED_000144 [Lentinula edodes]